MAGPRVNPALEGQILNSSSFTVVKASPHNQLACGSITSIDVPTAIKTPTEGTHGELSSGDHRECAMGFTGHLSKVLYNPTQSI